MALSPKQALGDKLIQEQNKIEELEKFFDTKLVAEFNGREGVSIGRPNGCNAFVLKTVLERFEQSGWEVKTTSDQRDGDYITFRPKVANGG